MRSLQPIYHDTLDSTNSEAWRLIDSGIGVEGMVVIAKSQTSGRGQRDREWRSPNGGLYLSVILQPQIPASLGSQITIWSVWGIASTLSNIVPSLKIKWLNDLVVENRKLGGILTETRVSSGIITYAVLGVGINWLNDVPDVGVALADLACNLENLESLESLVLLGISHGWEYWQKYGIESILPMYMQLISSRSVQIGDRSGSIIDITATGDLVVQWQNSLDTSILKAGSISLGYGS
jgi:BirA family biotin operon repressor/biotin-[acetyl-CoA-carboxylase] ligase